MHRGMWMAVLTMNLGTAACMRMARAADAQKSVRPGITVLVEDSLGLIHNRRIGLATNQTGRDEHGVSDIDVLRTSRVRAAGARLIRLFSPEHGIRGTEDRPNLPNTVDEQSGLPIISLYASSVIPPPDSTVADLDAIIVDLQDVGTHTWTYDGVLLYIIEVGARRHLPVIVLDRPNPVTGVHVSGPMLDSALATPFPGVGNGPVSDFAVFPLPLRHGMTFGELARLFNRELHLNADLHVIPVSGWRRAEWFDATGLPWIRPSPNLPDLTSLTTYPSVVPFESSNLSVGRGTPIAFQHFGAPWLDAARVAQLLNGRGLPGVRFVVDSFTPQNPTDGKFGGRKVAGVRIDIADRDAMASGRMACAILWAVLQTNRDSLRINARGFDLRLGSPQMRSAIQSGADPDVAFAAGERDVNAFLSRSQWARLYP